MQTPKSLRKTFIKTDCQNSQLTTKFRNFTNKSWGDRSKKKNDSSDKHFFSFSKLPVGAPATGFSVEALPREWHSREERKWLQLLLVIKVFSPNGLVHMAVLFVVCYLYPFRSLLPKLIYTTSVKHS